MVFDEDSEKNSSCVNGTEHCGEKGGKEKNEHIEVPLSNDEDMKSWNVTKEGGIIVHDSSTPKKNDVQKKGNSDGVDGTAVNNEDKADISAEEVISRKQETDDAMDAMDDERGTGQGSMSQRNVKGEVLDADIQKSLSCVTGTEQGGDPGVKEGIDHKEVVISNDEETKSSDVTEESVVSVHESSNPNIVDLTNRGVSDPIMVDLTNRGVSDPIMVDLTDKAVSKCNNGSTVEKKEIEEIHAEKNTSKGKEAKDAMDGHTECKGKSFHDQDQIDVVESSESDDDDMSLFSSECSTESSVNLSPIKGATSDSSKFLDSDMTVDESMNPFRNKDFHSGHVELERLRDNAKSFFNVLTKEEEDILTKVVENKKEPCKKIAELGGEVVHQASLNTLRQKCWLNDEVINFMMYFFQQRDLQRKTIMDDGSSLLFFRTQFYSAMVERHGYDYGAVKNWRKFWGETVDIFSFNTWFIPVNLGNSHWTLVVVFMDRKRIHYLDSLMKEGHGVMMDIFQYLCDEYRTRHGKELPNKEAWKFISVSRIPQQGNTYDCGMYTLMFTNTISVGLHPTFTPKDIIIARKRIGLRILQQKNTSVHRSDTVSPKLNTSVHPSDVVSSKVRHKRRKQLDDSVPCWVKQGKMLHIATYCGENTLSTKGGQMYADVLYPSGMRENVLWGTISFQSDLGKRKRKLTDRLGANSSREMRKHAKLDRVQYDNECEVEEGFPLNSLDYDVHREEITTSDEKQHVIQYGMLFSEDDKEPKPFEEALSLVNYEEFYRKLWKTALPMACSTSAPFRMLGMSAFTSRYPSIKLSDGSRVMIARPNRRSLPSTEGGKALKNEVVTSLAEHLTECVYDYLNYAATNWSREVSKQIKQAKEKIHENCFIGNSIFTSVALVNDLEDGYNHIHKDRNDLISVIVTLGHPIEQGGTTRYYAGKSEDDHGEVLLSVKHQHGRYQIAPFHDILHDAEYWRGPRCVLSFILMKNVYDHFFEYGKKILCHDGRN